MAITMDTITDTARDMLQVAPIVDLQETYTTTNRACAPAGLPPGSDLAREDPAQDNVLVQEDPIRDNAPAQEGPAQELLHKDRALEEDLLREPLRNVLAQERIIYIQIKKETPTKDRTTVLGRARLPIEVSRLDLSNSN
jgi:hypothetical protein